jgi:hypothetical protein
MKSLTIITLLLAFNATFAFATADGPDSYKVRNVEKGDVLNIRADHSADAKSVGSLQPDTKGVIVSERWPRWDSDAPPTEEMIKDNPSLNKDEKEYLIKNKGKSFWCKVRYKKIVGWVNCKFLGESE